MEPHLGCGQKPPVISGVSQASGETPPPLPKRRRTRAFLLVVSLVLFGLLLLIFFQVGILGVLLGPYSEALVRTGQVRLREHVIERGPSSNRIAVVRVEGIIARTPGAGLPDTVDLVRAALDAAAEDGTVKAVVLSIDSPGGEALASDLISGIIKRFQDKTRKPVVAQMGSMAASGGYYIAAPCRWIVAHKMTLTGSIGVIFGTINYRGLLDKVGLRPLIYKRGQYKDMLSGMREPESIKPEEEQMVYVWLDEVYEQFKSVVQGGRLAAYEASGGAGRRLADDWDRYADGRILSGQQAFELGFVDELGDFNVAISRAKKLAGILDAEVFEYRPRLGFLDVLGVETIWKSKTLTLDLGITLPRIEPGRVYFLTPFMFE